MPARMGILESARHFLRQIFEPPEAPVDVVPRRQYAMMECPRCGRWMDVDVRVAHGRIGDAGLDDGAALGERANTTSSG